MAVIENKLQQNSPDVKTLQEMRSVQSTFTVARRPVFD